MDARMERTRREFFRDMGFLAGSAAAVGAEMPAFAADAAPDLIVVSGEDPKAMVKKAIAELGGMKKFVSKGDVVVIKPNIGFERTPEQAACTNPDVVVGLIEMAFDAGAKEIKLFDRSVQDPVKCYPASGIPDAAKKAGAKVFLPAELTAVEIPIKDGVVLKKSAVWKDALDCDCFISVPIAKHHRMTQLTLALKNNMGLTADDRGALWHPNLHQALADFASAFKPKLTVLDAYRIIVTNGPRGGSAADIQMPKKCIVGLNPVSVDAYGTTLFPALCKKPSDIRHLDIAAKMGLGEIDVAKLTIRQVTA
jgi:uncharacterized protein (DUF362 family)